MNRLIIYLACSLLILCATSRTAEAQPRPQKDRPTARKKSNIGVKEKPNTTVATDLSVVGEQPNCYEHSARVRISRIGAQLANSFYVSLKIYKNNSLVESMEQLVAPFTNTYQHIYFTTQTKLLRMEAAEQISCQFTADAHNQVSEANENNNMVTESAPLLGFGPHE